jgi:glycosyltransferase involved in cell wall biosynthesis
VGRLVEHKGHRVLLEACGSLPSSLVWRLLIAGSGPEVSRLRAAAGKIGISDRVTFKTGLSDAELTGEYRGADVFVLPSLETRTGAEGFGIVLLDAMAEGIPIVASDTGGIGEVLENGSCGVMVPPGEPAALVAAIVRVAEDPAARRLITEKAFERVREHYAWR